MIQRLVVFIIVLVYVSIARLGYAVTVTSCQTTPSVALVGQPVTFSMTVSGAYTMVRINVNNVADPLKSFTVNSLSFNKTFDENSSWSIECQAANNSPPVNGSAWLTVQHANPNHAPTVTSHLSVSPNPPVAGQPLTLTIHANDTDGDTLAYVWNFGDGPDLAPSSLSQQTHTYPPGTYTVSVGCSDNIAPPNHGIPYVNDQLAITIPGPVNHPPVIDTQVSTPRIEIPFGTSATFSWKAHDPDGDPMIASIYYFDGPKKINQTTSVMSDTHLFNVPGDHTILLTVSDQKGGLVVSQPFHLTVDENKPPTITSISVNPTTGNVGNTFTVTVNATDPEGGTVAKNLYWGDKTNSSNGNTSHVYSAAGMYHVVVEAYDDYMASSFGEVQIQVGNPTPNSSPVFMSEIAISPTAPKVSDPFSVNFAYKDPDNDSAGFTLSVGGDLPGGGTAPPVSVYFLHKPIIPTVGLILDDGRGGTAVKSTTLKFGLPSTPPTITSNLQCLTIPSLGTNLTFDMGVQAQDQMEQYYDFGGGPSGSNTAVFHSGPATVISVAIDKTGHLVYNTLTLFSEGPPASNSPPVITSVVSASPNPSLLNGIVTFNVGATDPDGDVLSYQWDFGDGGAGTGPTATHAYSALGTYVARVVMSDGRGGVANGNVNVSVSNSGSGPDPSNPNQTSELFNPMATPSHPMCIPGGDLHSLVDRRGRHVLDFSGCLNVATNGAAIASGTYWLKDKNIKVSIIR